MAPLGKCPQCAGTGTIPCLECSGLELGILCESTDTGTGGRLIKHGLCYRCGGSGQVMCDFPGCIGGMIGVKD